MFASLPPLMRWLIWLMIAVIVVILIALVVHALGGFDWSLKIGYLHFKIGVTGSGTH